MDVANITFFLQFFVRVKRLASMLHTCGYDVTWGNLLQPMDIRGCLFAPVCLSIGQQKMDSPKSYDTIPQKPQHIHLHTAVHVDEQALMASSSNG
jgi:hypothetical protein